MWRLRSTAIALSAAATLAGCGHSAFAVRPLPRIVAENLGKPVSRLQDTFGEPRKIEVMPTKLVYVWFIAQAPAGAPQGFHGCEMEVTVDVRSTNVLGYSMTNIGWSKCPQLERHIRVAER